MSDMPRYRSVSLSPDEIRQLMRVIAIQLADYVDLENGMLGMNGYEVETDYVVDLAHRISELSRVLSTFKEAA